MVQCGRLAVGVDRSAMQTDRHGHRVLVLAAISWSLALTPRHACHAQSETDSAKTVRQTKEEGDLAKAAQNPVANMVSLPLQYNYSTGAGLGTNSAMVLNVQPVLPLPIDDRWLIVSRTVVPFTNVPLGDIGRASGVADIEEQAYFTAAKPGKITWAVGPIFSFPTATNSVLRTGQWGLGPTAVVLGMPGPWVIGALVNNVWRIGGEIHGTPLNTFTTQPFINLNLPRAWAISTSPLITSNWSAQPSQRWTVPLGLGFSKVAHIGDQPMNFEIQYYHNVNHPTLAGSNTMRLEASALWPTAAAKAAKEKEAKEAKEKEIKAEQAKEKGSAKD
jgi:hypothetical protein